MKRRTVRGITIAVALASAGTLLLTGCGPENDRPGSSDAAAPPASTTAAPVTPVPSATSTPTASAPASTAPPASPGSAPSGGAAAHCAAADVTVSSAQQAKIRPSGTGTGAVVIGITNTSGSPCTLEGFPTVAGAGNGSPDKNVPLTASQTGTAAPVRLAPGGKAWTKLTFVQVQGEGDGSCTSGTDPVVYPTLVIGVPQAGKHQIGLDNGQIAECDNKVTVTPLTSAQPS